MDLAEQRIKAHIAQHLPGGRVWLFGSRARGDALRRSDFDLAVELRDHADTDLWALEEAILADPEIIYSVDVVNLASAPKGLREKVTAEGILWTK